MTLESRATIRDVVRFLVRIGSGLCFAALFVPAPALAQPATTTGRPRVTWIQPARPGDATGSAGSPDPMGELALEPLRLSLFGQHALVPTGQCGDQEAETRTAATGGLRRMAAFGTNLLGGSSWRSPRLSLFGFSRMGCALDAAAGVGMTFTVPLQKNVAFTLSGGALYLPVTNPGLSNPAGAPVRSGTVRAGVVFRRPNGGSFNVGVDTLIRGFTFGGSF
jgi:hypothetical protein